jgi:translation elongation factor EF-4
VITREEYLGGILKLLEEKRGTQKKFEYIGGGRVMLTYELPLNEIVLDFYDRLKSSRAGTPRSTTTSRATAFRPWCGWTCWWPASRWTRCP